MNAHRELTLEIEGHTLAALAFNEDKVGTPFVFIHGITSSPQFWVEGQTPVIDDNYRWYSLSLPGHYPATLPPGFAPENLTAEMMARVLSEAVRRLTGGEPAVLVGHSTGGFSALAIAAHAPELAHSVVSISGFARGKWTGMLGLLQWLARRGAIGKALFKANMTLLKKSLDLYYSSLRFYAADVEALYAYPGLRSIIRALYEDLQHLDLDVMHTYFKRMPEIDITGWLERVAAPTLAVAGEKDPIVPPAQARAIAERVQQGEFRLVEGAGHLPMTERPNAYHGTVNTWIEKILENGNVA